MKITLSGVAIVEDYNDTIVNFTRNNLEVNNKEYERIIRLNLPNYRHILPKVPLYAVVGKTVYIPFGFFKDLVKELEKDKVQVEYVNATNHNESANISDTIKLYKYQEKCVEQLIKAKNGILKAKCGSGKTLIALKLIAKLNKRTLWITHTRTLLTQTLNVAEQVLHCDIGTITEGRINIGKDLTIATIQTLYRMDLSLISKYFDMVIVDEAHRFLGSDYTKYNMATKVLSNIFARYKFGLTATPKEDNKSDFTCLKALFGDIVSEVSEEDLEGKIIKAKLDVRKVNIEYDVNDITNEDGTFNYTNFLDTIVNNINRNNMIVDNIIKESESGKKQLVLTHRLKHIETLERLLKLKAPNLKVSTTLDNKKEIVKDYDILISTYSKIKEGFNDIRLNTLHMATPVKDKVSIVQSIGRIERNYVGKETPNAIYYLDNTIKYSLICLVKIRKYMKGE